MICGCPADELSVCVSVPISADQLIAVAASAFCCHGREGRTGGDGGNEWSVRDAAIDEAEGRGKEGKREGPQ